MTDKQPQVLIVGAVSDWSAQQVAQELDAERIDYSWLDPYDFPKRTVLAADLTNQIKFWNCRIQATPEARPSDTTSWSRVRSIFYRRPRDFDLPAQMSPPERRFARAQARIGLGGTLISLRARWINHPSALADAEYKPLQLAVAVDLGFTIPPTLITNSAAEVRRFNRQHGPIVTKTLGPPIADEAGGQSIAWTHPLTSGELDTLYGIEHTAHLFQKQIDKLFEVRLIAIGSSIFTIAIHAESTATKIDWRRDYDSLSYEPVDPPMNIVRLCENYLEIFNLTFGAFDFIVRPDGEWVFLECNAAGQWGWLAEACNLPIPEAFAQELLRGLT